VVDVTERAGLLKPSRAGSDARPAFSCSGGRRIGTGGRRLKSGLRRKASERVSGSDRDSETTSWEIADNDGQRSPVDVSTTPFGTATCR
jgi:hypothetical protein